MTFRTFNTLIIAAFLTTSVMAADLPKREPMEIADSKSDKKKQDKKKQEKKDKEAAKKKAEEEKRQQIFGSATSLLGAATPLSLEDERAIGGTVAVKSFSEKGRLLANDEVQEYVNKIGLALVRETPRAGQEFSFAVVDSDDVASWAAPGGYVFITKALLAQMQDESELAGVLAHEIAHVSQEHMLKMMKRDKITNGLKQAATALSKDDLSKYSKAADFGNDILFTKGLDHNMEYEADLVGVEDAATTGYDPAGLIRVLTRIKATGGRNTLLSTHPEIGDRIARINQKLTNELSGIEGAQQKERFQQIVGKALNKS